MQQYWNIYASIVKVGIYGIFLTESVLCIVKYSFVLSFWFFLKIRYNFHKKSKFKKKIFPFLEKYGRDSWKTKN